jgi:hypothetical protein
MIDSYHQMSISIMWSHNENRDKNNKCWIQNEN